MSIQKYIRSTWGFTLIEIMVVVSLLGLIAGLTIPSFAQYLQRQKVVGARNELMADIQYARSLAIARRQTFQIDFEQTQYDIIIPGPNTIIRTKTAPGGVQFNADTDPNFYPWGLSDACNVAVNSPLLTSNVTLLPNGTVDHD
jgi:prepilin-type N-terminal cleavage/methylation domain-containing protein